MSASPPPPHPEPVGDETRSWAVLATVAGTVRPHPALAQLPPPPPHPPRNLSKRKRKVKGGTNVTGVSRHRVGAALPSRLERWRRHPNLVSSPPPPNPRSATRLGAYVGAGGGFRPRGGVCFPAWRAHPQVDVAVKAAVLCTRVRAG